MYRLLNFFKKYYVILLFVVLEIIAINYYADSTSYTRAVVLSASNKVTGGVNKTFASVGDYFSLGRDNRMLLERVVATETELAALKEAMVSSEALSEEIAPKNATDSLAQEKFYTPYIFSTAKVISNTIARQDNFFIINKGLRDGLEENMAVLSSDGSVAGFVRKCSDKYAVCVSVLNREFTIGGQFKGSEYFGSVFWDGTDSREMTLVDVPRYADVNKGDTLLSAHSLRFPPDSFIGTVSSIKESDDGTFYIIKIRLGAKMTALSDVILVKYNDYEELDALAGSNFVDGIKEENK